MTTSDLQQERWVRWGHKRKPNKVVLKLYSFFDLIGDFVPMYRTLFTWIGRTAMATWKRIGQSIMILVNLLLMAGIIYLSVHHSYKLCVRVGYYGIDAWVAVGVFETLFVYCSQVIQNAYKNGKKQGVMPWLGFLAGFAFVVTSNYTGMADTKLAKTIGVSMPCLLLIMKGVLAYQFRQSRKEAPIKKKVGWLNRLAFWRGKEVEMDIEMNKQDTHTQEGNHSHNIVSHTTLSQHTLTANQSAHTHTETTNVSQLTHTNKSVRASLTEENVSQSSQDVLTVSQQKVDHYLSQTDEAHTNSGKEKASQEEMAHSKESLSRAGLDVEEISQTEDSHNEVRDQNLSQTATVSQEGILTTEEETSSHNDSHTQTQSHNSHTKISHTQTEAHTSQKDSHTHAEAHTQNSSHKKSHTLTQKKSHNESSQDENETKLLTNLEEIKKKALKYAEKKGEFPSIRVLAKEAPCSPWLARRAKNELEPKAKKGTTGRKTPLQSRSI
jgi:hypothetical protein